MLKSVNLFVQREGEQQCKKFWLDGIGSFADNPAGRGLTFTYERGAAPLVVTQDTPQDHVLVFELRKDADVQHVEHPYFEGKNHYVIFRREESLRNDAGRGNKYETQDTT